MVNRIFTEEDKKLRPKVYIQSTEPETSEDHILFKVEEDEDNSSAATLKIKKDGTTKSINLRTSSDMISMKDGSGTLDDKLNNLDGEVIEEILLAANWITSTDVPYVYTIERSIDLEKDVEIYLNSSNTTIIEQCAKASIISGKHNQTNIQLIAYGEKPTVNIPIKLVVVKRTGESEEPFTLFAATEETLGGIKEGESVVINNDTLELDIKSLLDELSDLSK